MKIKRYVVTVVEPDDVDQPVTSQEIADSIRYAISTRHEHVVECYRITDLGVEHYDDVPSVESPNG